MKQVPGNKNGLTQTLCHFIEKGPQQKGNNNLRIALISNSCKIILHIMNECFKLYASNEIAPEQASFVKESVN